MVDLGVFPVNQTVFKIGTKGKGSVEADMAIVKDMETLGISVDNGIEEWNPLDQEGWKSRLMTAKSMTIRDRKISAPQRGVFCVAKNHEA